MIRVPFPWESFLSGLEERPPDRYVRGRRVARGGTGWYRRSVEVPVDWRDQRVFVLFGAAYWHTTVWVEGRWAGEHDGGYDPFEVEVTDLVPQDGIFSLTVRVWAPEDTDQYPHGKNTDHWYSRASGIWQSVYLEARPHVYISDLATIATPADGKVTVTIGVTAPSFRPDASIEIELIEADRPVADSSISVSLAAGVSEHRVETMIPDPRPWSPEEPHLYQVRARLRAGGHEDELWSHLGFRSIELEALPGKDTRYLTLNGRPVYVRGVMIQGYHPDGIYAYPDVETIRADLQAAKDLGFNLVRVHCKMEDPRLLYWADRLGVMLWCEVPNFLTPTEEARSRWRRTWEAMLARDRSHPSIVLWGMFIESWGLGVNQFGFGGATEEFANDRAMQAWVGEMYRLGRSIDTTRPIIENSVADSDHTVAEINDFHLFPDGYAELQSAVEESVQPFVDNAHPGSTHNFAPGFAQADQPILCSSTCGWESVDGVEISWPFHVITNALRGHERICGYGWVQLYDVEWERTGLLDYRRVAKELGYDVRDLNGDDALSVRGPLARQVAIGDEIEADVALSTFSGRTFDRLLVASWLDGYLIDGVAYRSEVQRTSHRKPAGPNEVVELGVAVVPGPRQPFAGHLWIEARDGGDVIARTLIRVAVGDDGPDPDTSRSRLLPLDRWHGEGVDVQLVAGEPHRLTAADLSVPLPLEGLDAGWRFTAEVGISPADPWSRGVDDRGFVELTIDGERVHRVSVPFLAHDSRGVLSQVNGIGGGAHGELIDVELPKSPAGATLRMHVTDGRPGDRLAIFGSRLGRHPDSPALRR